MTDPVSGNAASPAGRLGLQVSGGREPVETGRIRSEMAMAGKPRARITDGEALVSEGRDAARRMAAEPPVDTRRVAELRKAIARGQYRVDPHRIADAMLRSEPGLLRD